MKKHYKTTKKLQINTNTPPPIITTHHPTKNKMMTTHLTSREAIRERNLQMERQSILNERARRRRARAMARRARANAPHAAAIVQAREVSPGPNVQINCLNSWLFHYAH